MNVADTLDWLRTSPLVGVVLTLVAYRIGREVQQRTHGHALAQPVLVAIVLIGGAMWLIGIDYEGYLAGGAVIAFLLGPATVALAVPLHRQSRHLRALALPMLVAIPVGAVVSITSAVLLVRWLGGTEELALTLAPKAATTPVALALSDTVGGLPPLTAVLAILIGILGAVAGPAVLDLLRIRDRSARGIALGAVSHGIGTSRALQEDRTEGAFAGLSMGLTALTISLLLPVVLLLI
ncbi:LrgB family protein [Nocardioides sp.]|uniref:LrgB family protein n=1 Tax=Nocardioides sp. TaxID=35761 RepID=UPI0027329189|nr:LrgB family protein [Nocardioides sp.]MDP3891626.1 LrgB family protein [Nocardioides sp.]